MLLPSSGGNTGCGTLVAYNTPAQQPKKATAAAMLGVQVSAMPRVNRNQPNRAMAGSIIRPHSPAQTRASLWE